MPDTQQSDDVFIDLEVLAASTPVMRDNGDVVHSLYVGTPRTKFVRHDGEIDLMVYACLLCTAQTTPRQGFRSPSGMVEHLHNFHRVQHQMVIPKGKAALSQIAGRQVEADSTGFREEVAIIDHPCQFCRAMIQSGKKFNRGYVPATGETVDSCLACGPKLRREMQQATPDAASDAAPDVPEVQDGE